MRRGFTLIELVIVIALISILSVSLGPKVLLTLGKAKVSETLSSLDDLRMSLKVFQVENGKSAEHGTDFDEGFDNVFGGEDGEVPKTPSTNGIGESSKIYLERTNEGGWIYFEDTEELYANLPNGIYTGKANEIWDGEEVVLKNILEYNFSDKEGGGLGELAGTKILTGNWKVDENGEIIPIGNKANRVTLDNFYENYEFSFKVNTDQKFQIFTDYEQGDKTGSQIITVDMNKGDLIFSEHEGKDGDNNWKKIDKIDSRGVISSGEQEYKVKVTTDDLGNRVSELSVGGIDLYKWTSTVAKNSENNGVKIVSKGNSGSTSFSDLKFTELN